MSLLFAFTGGDEEPWIRRFRALLPDHPLFTPATLTRPELIHYGIGWRHEPGAFKGLPNLSVLFALGAGVDGLLGDPELPDVPLVRVVDPDLRDRMSEWVVLHALLHHRQFRRYDRQQAAKLWSDDPLQPAARDVRIGVLGLGVLGLDAARKLQSVGFDVAGWSRSARTIDGFPTFHSAAGLEALLARTDILVCLLPLTDETRGLLNRDLIGKLAKDGRLGGPVLINAGRGGLQVEADLLTALDGDALIGVSLDVFEREPLPASSPLWRHPKAFLTPHNSAISAPDAVASYVARQILAFERGEPLQNVVDRKRGY
jgi:glyoxylate/hydroxypyruvate reductase A